MVSFSFPENDGPGMNLPIGIPYAILFPWRDMHENDILGFDQAFDDILRLAAVIKILHEQEINVNKLQSTSRRYCSL